MDTNQVKKDTERHIEMVSILMLLMTNMLKDRAKLHDKSKLEEPEFSTFEIYTEKLKGCTYGSDKYKGFLKDMKPALDHHYKVNMHHPEHFENGVNGMTLIDLMEMFCDWKAATLRHDDGDINKSIELNKDRFKMSDQLVNIFKNSVKLFN